MPIYQVPPHARGDAFAVQRDELLSALHCALPGIVEAWHPDTRTADVRPAIPQRHADGSFTPLPLVPDAPVFLPGWADVDPEEAVHPGDECLLIFADACIDAWYATGSVQAPPLDRKHDLSDAFAFVGFHSRAAGSQTDRSAIAPAQAVDAGNQAASPAPSSAVAALSGR